MIVTTFATGLHKILNYKNEEKHGISIVVVPVINFLLTFYLIDIGINSLPDMNSMSVELTFVVIAAIVIFFVARKKPGIITPMKIFKMFNK